MPIGVPKVALRFGRGDDSNVHWLDVYNRLYESRILFLASDLDDELSNQIIGLISYLTMKSKYKDIFLYINSLGGAIGSGFSVYDWMKNVNNRVITCCLGTSASMASFLLCAGEKGFRLALSHSRVMIHQPAGGTRGQGKEIVGDSSQVHNLRIKMTLIYCEITGQKFTTIQEDMARDNYMQAQEAFEYGLVDIKIHKRELGNKSNNLPTYQRLSIINDLERAYRGPTVYAPEYVRVKEIPGTKKRGLFDKKEKDPLRTWETTDSLKLREQFNEFPIRQQFDQFSIRNQLIPNQQFDQFPIRNQLIPNQQLSQFHRRKPIWIADFPLNEIRKPIRLWDLLDEIEEWIRISKIINMAKPKNLDKNFFARKYRNSKTIPEDEKIEFYKCFKKRQEFFNLKRVPVEYKDFKKFEVYKKFRTYLFSDSETFLSDPEPF